MRIAISGHSGCGNTTATTNVGRALGLNIVNYTFRDLAKEIGMSFDELHREAPTNSIFDYLTDLKCIRASLHENIVLGTRLAAWLMDADLRIWLHAPLEARARRINKRESERESSYESVLYKTMKRDEQNRVRYLQLYGLDIHDHADFDITINTDKLTAEQVSSLIVAAAQWATKNKLERKNLHIKRIQTIIADKLKLPEQAFIDPSFDIDVRDIFARLRKV
jgi:cytidylate kinase